MTLKKLIGKIHLYLGLVSGIVVLLVSLSGCIYVFEEEINLMLQTGVYRNVDPQQQEFITPGAIRQKVEEAFDSEITYMSATVYPTGDRASIIWVRDQNRKYTAFILNPYSGEIIDSYPYSTNFWAIILTLHTSLLIPGFGHHIVGVSTLIFVIMLISGLFLWFPKSKKGYKQRFRVKWGASPKRLNYDLHNVLGFYMTWVVIFVAITGLVWSYQWVEDGVYWLASGGDQQKELQMPLSDTTDIGGSSDAIDRALQQITTANSKLRNYVLVYPGDSTAVYRITLNYQEGAFYNQHDSYAIDQYTGEILGSQLWKETNMGDKLMEANYNIHVGAILGLPGKFLAFCASLIAASLPITGFVVWRGRKKKKSKRLEQIIRKR
ncbi:MAG: PepSY-associated TM helix domain-containing protein [Marinoscillum sp.]